MGFDEQTRSDECENDGIHLRTKALHSQLTRIMYNRRNKFNPLFNSVVVGGFEDDGVTPYLGYVDNIGTAFNDDFITTGFGAHLALPLLRKHWKADFTKEQAVALLQHCLTVLYYRDCRTMNRVRFAIIERGEGAAGAGGDEAEERMPTITIKNRKFWTRSGTTVPSWRLRLEVIRMGLGDSFCILFFFFISLSF